MTVTAIAAAALVAVLAGGCGDDLAPDPHAHHAADARDGDSFTVEELARFGVGTATAGPGEIDASLVLPGEVRPNADRLAHLAPRFAGVAREVRKQVGDAVRAGDILAVIESDTLAPFELRAPFDGIVLDRHVVPGEAVGRDRAAFILADLRTVWIDVAVYQRALPRVWPGRAVHVTASHGGAEADGVIAFISPIVDQATRTASARVVLPNSAGAWRPGLFVSATVSDPAPVEVAVPLAAVQRRDDRAILFVVAGDRFVPRPVVLGRAGRTQVEVVSGLSPGERFAVDGAFLVKADLEKRAGEHGH